MSICRACLKRDKALDIGLPEENWHVLDRLVLAIRTTDINYSMANGNDEENLNVSTCPTVVYIRLVILCRGFKNNMFFLRETT